MNSHPAVIAIALANHAVRLIVVTQLDIPINFVPRCNTCLCILTAINGAFLCEINGSNVSSDEEITDSVPQNRLFQL
jgi:hypothetical protein